MRFDEFVAGNNVVASPVDRFDGLLVDAGVPPEWEPFDSDVGIGVWVCRNDPCINKFCANAVLTMHRVQPPLNADQVFAMLTEQQLQSEPDCHELRREFAPATEGPGAIGVLGMHITHELGTIDSVSRSRIIATEQETLIAQLTVTALHDSPVERANIWLAVRIGTAAAPPSAGNHGSVAVTGTQNGR